MNDSDEMPVSWAKENLSKIVDYKKGKKPKKMERSPFKNSLVYLDIRAIEKGNDEIFVDVESSNITNETELVIVWDGARAGWVGKSRKGALGSTLMALKPKIDKDYLFRFLQTQFQYLQTNHRGTGIPHVDPDIFWNIPVPIAPLPEQQRIVAKLDALFEKIESNKQRLDKIPKLLKRFRQSVLAAAVSGKLTEDWREWNDFKNQFDISNGFEIDETYKELLELPLNWKWVALGNYVKCNRGRFSIRPRNDPRYFGGNIPFIQIGDLPREGGYVSKHTQTLNDAGLKVSKMFPKNTIAMAIVGATIANTGILAYDMCFTDSMVGMNTGVLDLNKYLDYYLRIEKENFRQLSYAGGGQPNIKLELLNAYPFPLPPLEEQKEIVKQVEQLFAFADRIEVRYIKAKAMLDKFPQSILAKAFRGELVSQNSEDEPASVLLARINEEKEKLRQAKTDKKVKKSKEYSLEQQPLKMVAERKAKYKKG
jgi:type I restriction enzyme S subunit